MKPTTTKKNKVKSNCEIKEACERSIVLAADSVEKLRVSDVMRVIEDFFFTYGTSAEIVEYISAARPDLASESRQCQLELVAQ